MGIDSIDFDLSYGGERSSDHELIDYGSRWEGREVIILSGDSLEILPLNFLQPSIIHLPTIASSEYCRVWDKFCGVKGEGLWDDEKSD